MSLTIVPGLPNGALICCKQYKGRTYYGTSLGDLLFVEEDGLGESLAGGATSKRLKFNSPILKIDVSQAGLEINLLISTKNGLYLKQLPELGSNLPSPKTTPLKTVADHISLQKNAFIWSSDQVIYNAEISSAGLRSRKFSHVKSDVIQIEMSSSYHILICTSESVLLAKRNEPIEVVAELPQFSATITGACFDHEENVIFTDTSGSIEMINQQGETLWETKLGYQSGYRPGRLLFLSSRILSSTTSSLCTVNIAETSSNELSAYSISGSIQDVSSYGGSEFIVISSGKAMKSIATRKSKIGNRPEPKSRIEAETVDLEKAFSAARGFFSQIKKQVSKKKEPVLNKVKQVASQVTESLSREIFDDEIFQASDDVAEKPELSACGNDDKRENSSPSPADPSSDTDMLIIERKIKPKKKKCQRETKQDIQQEREKSILQEAEKQFQLPNIQKSIKLNEIIAKEIAEAIDKAFQKVEKEENSTESSSSIHSAQFAIPIITSTHFESSLSSPKSSSPSDSWIVIEENEPESSTPSEYDEVINTCYDEI